MFLNGWTYRKKLTVDNTKVDSNLTDFPVLVKLTSSNFDFSKAKADGSDIRFTSSDGETLLKFEREFHGIDSHTKLLLHCNGINESTVFTDVSSVGRTVTAMVNAQVDTAQQKFSTGSVILDAVNGTSLHIPNANDLGFGTGDFTLETQIRFNSLSGNQDLFAWESGGADLQFYWTGSAFRVYLNGAVILTTSGETINVDEWHHYACVRNGDNWQIYIDGISRANATYAGSLGTPDGVNGFRIGGRSRVLDQGVNGWMDEVRISKGIARWTSNFTPPIAEYDADTIDRVYSSLTLNTNFASADSNYGASYTADKAIDDNLTTFWASNIDAPPHWWKYDFGSGNEKILEKIAITPWGDGNGYGVKDFTIQGSNDDSNWNTLHTNKHPNDDTKVEYGFINTTLYRYYRIHLTTTWRTAYSKACIKEIELLESKQEAFYWVKVPSILSATGTDIYVYYGNSGASDGEDAQNVWDSDYKAVYHLKESGDGTADEFKDSTVNIHHGQGQGTVPTQIDSVIYKGQDGAGTNSYISALDSDDFYFDANFTIEWKMRWQTSISNGSILGQDSGSGSNPKWFINYGDLSAGNLTLHIQPGSASISFVWTPIADTDYHCVLKKSGNDYKFFVDNVQIGGTQVNATAISNVSAPFNLFTEGGAWKWFSGILDEVRISKGIARNDATIKALYNSDNNTLLAFGIEEENVNEVLEDIDSDIRVKHTEAIEDIDADIRAVVLVEEDIDSDIRIILPTYFEDVDTDVRVSKLVTEDIDTDIRIQHTPVEEDIDTDIRVRAENLEDLNLDIRVAESIIEDINVDIRVKEVVFADINSDIRVAQRIFEDIDTDIRVKYIIEDTKVNIESLYIEEGYYLSLHDVTVVLNVAGATQVQFKNEEEAWSILESVGASKSWTLSAGDGDKVVYVRFKDIEGNFTDGLSSVSAVVSTTSSTPVTLEAYTDETATIPINDSTYIITNRAYFRWVVPTFAIPYEGFSVAFDTAPDNFSNIPVGDFVSSAIQVTKATPPPEMTINVSEGKFYSNSQIRDFVEENLTLDDGGVQDRIDLLYINSFDNVLNIIKGTEAASPIVSETPTDAVELATIYIPAGTTIIANVTITDIARRYIEHTQYLYEDIPEGQHTIQVTAQNINGVSSTVTIFNIWVANASPEMGSIKGYTDGTKTIELANGIYQTASSSLYAEWTVAPNEPGPIIYYYTEDGIEPTIVSSSTSNNYLNLGPYAAGTKVIKVKPRDSTTGVWGSTKEYTFVYGILTFTDDIAVISGSTVLRQSLKQIQVKDISWDFDSARTCSIFQPVEFDDTLPLSEGQDITVVYGSNNDTVFRGKIKLIERSIEGDSEGILYTCAGPRGELNEHYATIDDAIFGDTAKVVFEDEPVNSAIDSILGKFKNIVTSIQSYPTGANITDNYVAQTVSQTLDGIYSSTKYGWYIKPDGTLVSVDKTVTNPGEAKFGVYGTTVNSINPQYNVMASNLQFDSTARYNKIIIEGARQLKKITLQAHCATSWEIKDLLEEDEISEDSKFKIYKVNTNWPIKKLLHTSVNYARITGYMLIPLHDGFRIISKWFVRFVGPIYVCRANRLVTTSPGPVTRDYIGGSFSAGLSEVKSISTEIQGNLGPGNTIRFSKAMYTYWPGGNSSFSTSGYTTRSSYSISIPDMHTTRITYKVLGTLKKTSASVKADLLIQTIPLKVQVTVPGTASSLSKTLRVVNESFKYNEDPENLVDDTAKMIQYGQDLLQKYKDIKINGSIMLDKIDLTWDLNKTVNLINTKQGSWATLNAKVVGIKYNFDENTTTLEITSEFLR